MPCWYFEKPALKYTPSYKDGIDYEKESRYRREGSRFIMELGTQMGLRKDTMATGIVFFHRFYMIHSFNEFPRYVMATCCLFLAGKVEETPKKCKDIVRSAKALLESKKLDKYWPNIEDPIKETMTHERILLQSIKFDLQVDHPYSYLLKYAKTLKGDQESIRKMVQMAWTFINDSLCTTLCLQWEPEIIAIALMYLTSKLSKFEITDWISKKADSKQKWWEQFVEGLNVEILEDICHQVLDLYAQQQQQSPGQQQSSHMTSGQKVNSNSVKRKTSPPGQAALDNVKYFKPNESQPYRQPVPQTPPTPTNNSNNIVLVNDQHGTGAPAPPVMSSMHHHHHHHHQQQPPHSHYMSSYPVAAAPPPPPSPHPHMITTCTPPFISPVNTYTQSMMMQQHQQQHASYAAAYGGVHSSSSSTSSSYLPPPSSQSNSKMYSQSPQFQPQKPIISAYDSFYLNNTNMLQQQPPAPPPPPPPQLPSQQQQQQSSSSSRNTTLRMVDISGRKA